MLLRTQSHWKIQECLGRQLLQKYLNEHYTRCAVTSSRVEAPRFTKGSKHVIRCGRKHHQKHGYVCDNTRVSDVYATKQQSPTSDAQWLGPLKAFQSMLVPRSSSRIAFWLYLFVGIAERYELRSTCTPPCDDKPEGNRAMY